MTNKYSLERVAQAWCTDKTSGIVMDPILAEAFADILDSEREELEKLRVQLAACGVVALDVNDPAVVGDYRWSASYQDVLNLRLKYEKIMYWKV